VSIAKVIWVVLATMVIFAAGVITGGMVVQQRAKRPLPPPVYFNRFESARRAVNQLELTPDQHTRIDRIIRESQDHIADYFQILAPDITDTFRQMRENIRAELTPEQRRAFEERMQRWRSERNPARGNFRPGVRSNNPSGGNQRFQQSSNQSTSSLSE
jgi:hypothetical protein